MSAVFLRPQFVWAQKKIEAQDNKDSSKKKEQLEDDPANPVAPGVEETPTERTGMEKTFIDTNIAISQWFDSMAEGLDLFLAGGKQLTPAINESSATISNSTYVAERADPANSTSFGVNLKLPNLERYWNVKFTSYDETQERGVKQTFLRQTPREQNYGATLGLFRKLGNVRTSFRPRVELQNPIKVSHSLTFDSVADQKTYQINPKLEFFANANQGTGIFQAININFILSKIHSLTFINEGEYTDKTHRLTATNGAALGQSLNKTMSLSYGLFFSSTNEFGYHLEAYTTSIGFGHNLYKRVLDYQLVPQVVFSKSENFTGVPGASFNFNLNF